MDSAEQKMKQTQKEPDSTRQLQSSAAQFFSDLDVLSEAFHTVIPLLDKRDETQKKLLDQRVKELNSATDALKKHPKGSKTKAALIDVVNSAEALIIVVRKL